MALQILLVDDQPSVRNGIRSLLGARPGWTICGEASDGLEGIEKARALHPDVVLMDVSMPRMNGLEATRILRRELPSSKVVIVSQNDPIVVGIQAREVNASAHVAKQELFGTLLPVLDKLLGGPLLDVAAESFQPTSPAVVPEWLARSGELGLLIGRYDWSKTPLGPVSHWPQSLKTSVSLMLSSQHPMWIGWGPQATFLYNDPYIQVLGSAKHPWALGRPAAEVWSEIWDICGPLADKVFHYGEASFVDDVRLFMNRGDFFEETYYSFSYSPIRDESGNVGGLFCVSTEVTPKVINTRRLRTLSELAANALVQKTSDAACAWAAATLAKNPDDVPFALLYVIDRGEKYVRLQQACGLTGGTGNLAPKVVDLTGGSARRALWPFADVITRSRSRVVPIAQIEGFPLGAADQRLSQAVVLPIASRGEGLPLGVLVAGVNPTRRLDAEYQTFYDLLVDQVAAAIQNARGVEEEKKRLDALAELDRAKTAFFSNVSHEFRTPLTLMLGPIEELLSKAHTDLSPAAKAQLELVSRNGSRLLRLVNTLLDFSRLEAGRMQAMYQPTDLGSFTAELASVFRSATEKAGLELELDCARGEELIYVDRTMWEKIVLNLVSNAFKFTFEGKITVTLRGVGRNAQLQVRDTGVGIPQDELPRVFDRFHRIENTRSRTHEGSGIGLALVQELVKLHGGTIRVESLVGEGTTFVVTVPRGKDHLPADRISGPHALTQSGRGAVPFVEEALRWLPDGALDPASGLLSEINTSSAELGSGTTSTPDKRRPSVLVVDDNADMRQYLMRMLEHEYEVRCASDGEAALAEIRKQTPDLVLTDVMMPRLDGFGMIRELRADPKTRTTPVIVLSARAGEEARVEGMERGADDYLIKPFSVRELLARVQTHVQMARMRNESEDAVRSANAKFRAVFDQTTVFSGVLAIDGTLIDANRLCLDACGYTAEEVVGKPFWTTPWWRVSQEVQDKIQAACLQGAQGASFRAELPYHWADGTERLVDFELHPIRDEKGRVIFLHPTGVDVTEVKRTQENYRTLADNISQFAWMANRSGWMYWFNQRWFDYTGTTLDAMQGSGWHRALHPEHVNRVVAKITHSFENGQIWEDTFQLRGKDGEYRWFLSRAVPIKNAHGKITQWFGTNTDITELRNVQDALRKSKEFTEEQVRARTRELEARNAKVLQQSEQLRDLSHRMLQIQDDERRHMARELHDSAGQILAALGMSLANVAQLALNGDPQVAKGLSQTQLYVDQLSQEIRTTSYLLHPPLLDESGLPVALRWYVEGLEERNGMKVVLNVPDNLGRFGHEMELMMFRLVQECLTNIHRHSGSKTAEIRMWIDGAELRLEVHDQGRGIPPERLASIQAQGGGVGIRGMRERIHPFQGSMQVESNGNGTLVSFRIPIPKTESAVRQSAPQSVQIPA